MLERLRVAAQREHRRMLQQQQHVGYGGDGVKLQFPALYVSRQLLQLLRVGGVDFGGD
jgi:hypothetical protein